MKFFVLSLKDSKRRKFIANEFKNLNINDFEDVGEEESDREEWLDAMVGKYCEKFKSILYTRLITDLNSGVEEDE